MDPTSSILVIGNEILSGKTQDTNVSFLAKRLQGLGIDLREVRIVPDEEGPIIEALNALRTRYTYVFTTGGVGATHDDITGACVSKAFGVPYQEDAKLVEILKNYYGERFNENRRRLARIPKGASFIDNPISHVPSYFIGNVYCLAGMPSIMQGMFLSLEPKLRHGRPIYTRTLKCSLLEGDIAHQLTHIQNTYSDVSLGSYPFYTPADIGVKLVAQGRNLERIDQMMKELFEMAQSLQGNPQYIE